MTQDEYAELLQRIGAAYEKSDVKRDHPGWWYGVAATRILPGRPLILGFNWGADLKYTYKKPTRDCYPRQTFDQALQKGRDELGSLVRLRSYLEKYVNEVPLSEIGQSNLFYFRTRHATQLDQDDRRLCIEIFEDFLKVARPSLLIALSNGVSQELERIQGFAYQRAAKKFKMTSRGNCFTAVRANFALGELTGRWVAVPHPATPCTAVSRDQIWHFCFAETPTGAGP